MSIVELPESWRRRAQIVSDVSDAASWFSAEELVVIRAFTRPKRRKEWMLSRIAEKALRRGGAVGDCVSFSHSGRYGAAAIDVEPVGIDVETLREISESAARHFLTDDEIVALQQCTIPNRMLHFWSAKEALWKQRGGAMLTLKRVPLVFESETNAGLRFLGVETFAVDDLVAALTLSTS